MEGELSVSGHHKVTSGVVEPPCPDVGVKCGYMIVNSQSCTLKKGDSSCMQLEFGKPRMVRRYLKPRVWPILQTGKVKESWSPEHTQLPLTFFWTDFLMALGGQASQGLPERKLESVLPTVSNRGQRTVDRSPVARRLELAPRGRCDAIPDVARRCGHPQSFRRPWKTQYVKFCAEKQNFCGTNPVPGS